MATTAGVIITDFGSYDKGQYVIAQPDGKIVVLGITSGLSSDDLAIARYNSNGSLDASFDNDGQLIATAVMTINAVRLLSDGKFLTVGTSGADFAFARYNSDGSLDTTFDKDGIVTTDINTNSNDAAYYVLVQADGKFLIAGSSDSYSAAVRYNSDGSLDTSFSGDSIVSPWSNAPYFYGVATAAAVQPDGKAVLAGNYNTNNDFGVIRLNRDGTADTRFSGDGSVTTNLGGNDSVNTVTILSTGKILVAGTSDGNFAAVRYNIDGSLDTTFDSDSIITTDLGGAETLNSIIALADGKFIAAGTTGDKDLVLARYHADGSLDTGFSDDGVVITDLGGWEEGNSVTVQADGKILLVGSSDSDIALVRYNTDGSLDTSFNGTGSSPSNHPAKGAVTITGNAVKGQTLTAANTLTDSDGLGAITYQWQANGVNLTTGNSVTLTSAEIGKTITVTANYTDLLGTAESVSSAATSAVTDTPVSGTPGVNIIGSDFSTSEQGDAAVFNVSLNSAPKRDVTMTFTSSDASEGVITHSVMTFTSANWAAAQELVVTGQNDSLVDGDIAYTINAAITTLDVIYKAVTVNSLTLTNKDTPVVGVETITGTNSTDVLQGTSAPSYMLGEAGDDDLSGGAGDDTVYGSYGSDVLFGEEGNDTLYGEQDTDYLDGGAGNDILDGGLGLDTLSGGAGNDTYYLGYDFVDVIDDGGLADDVDTVIMPYQLSKYTLPTGIEKGTIAAGTQASSLTGNTGNNTLMGNDGKNTLSGAVGRDSLFGGLGDDVLNGGSGDDVLQGGVGKDNLTGGTGKDNFLFDTALNANTDKITDFKPIDDSIKLENQIFTKLAATGALNASVFVTAATAVDSDDYLVYNKATGALFYDADGSGAGAAVQIAALGVNLALTAADFVVI